MSNAIRDRESAEHPREGSFIDVGQLTSLASRTSEEPPQLIVVCGSEGTGGDGP